MTVIGLTGGIASGKSTVSAYLKELGIPVFDADAAGHQVEAAGSPTLRQLQEAFGPGILTPAGELNRGQLADLAFHDPKALTTLNTIVHRAIAQKRDAFLRQYAAAPVAVLDVPLLLETGWDRLTDQVWLVVLDREQQIQRAMLRSGMTRQEVIDRIDRQLPVEEKKKRAQVILDNSGTREDLYAQTRAALEKVLAQQKAQR